MNRRLATCCKGYRVLACAAAALVGLYFNFDLLPMAAHTLMPFLGLAFVGVLLGLALPARPRAAATAAWTAVVAAALVRRAATLHSPLATHIFGGVLAMGGYPPWAAWLAELLRLGVYLVALRSGARWGARLRRPAKEAA